MSKRRITRRQAWRIEKIQEERRQRAQKKDQQLTTQMDSGQLGPEQEGLLIAHYGTMVDVEDASKQQHRCQLRQHLGAIVAGDHIVWRAMGKGAGVVVSCLPRASVLGRPDAHSKIKPIAANIDQLLITAAPKPQLNHYLIDSYLVAAETLGIQPLIILNKVDILDKQQETTINQHLNLYKALDYPVLYASTYEAHGLDTLKQQLIDKVSVFVGQSGVGKSSLINAFLPEEGIRVGELSESSGRGRHTTTTAKLYHLQQGGDLIDSPGIREFGLWHMSADQIAQGYKEFRPFLGQCKFRNCSHRIEPGCALQQAVKDGIIHQLRLESYFKLIGN